MSLKPRLTVPVIVVALLAACTSDRPTDLASSGAALSIPQHTGVRGGVACVVDRSPRSMPPPAPELAGAKRIPAKDKEAKKPKAGFAAWKPPPMSAKAKVAYDAYGVSAAAIRAKGLGEADTAKELGVAKKAAFAAAGASE